MRATVQAVNSTMSAHPAKRPWERATRAAPSCWSASQSGSASERGLSSSSSALPSGDPGPLEFHDAVTAVLLEDPEEDDPAVLQRRPAGLVGSPAGQLRAAALSSATATSLRGPVGLPHRR